MSSVFLVIIFVVNAATFLQMESICFVLCCYEELVPCVQGGPKNETRLLFVFFLVTCIIGLFAIFVYSHIIFIK